MEQALRQGLCEVTSHESHRTHLRPIDRPKRRGSGSIGIKVPVV